MSPPSLVPEKLKGAKTLDEMLEAVPLLAECDTLEALPPLANYDRRADGWFTTMGYWLLVMLLTVGLMVLVVSALVWLGELLISAVGPSADELMNGLGGLPLRLLVLVLVAGLSVLFFYSMGPRKWLVNSTRIFRQRVRLRLLLLRAIRAHLDRNREIVGNQWRRAVCRICLARYECHRVRFAYWRWLGFARCRKCHSDHACYAHVRRIQGWLGHGMGESQGQAGDVVKVNLLHRLPPRSLSLPTDLDELVVADAEDEDVETLIFLYRREQPRTDLPKPKRLRCHLTGSSTVSLMGQRQLKRNFWLMHTAGSRAHTST
jgi:hypothetical protein